MNFLKNRTVIGVLCIVLSLLICFAITPLWSLGLSQTTEVVRVVKPIKIGEEITATWCRAWRWAATICPKTW